MILAFIKFLTSEYNNNETIRLGKKNFLPWDGFWSTEFRAALLKRRCEKNLAIFWTVEKMQHSKEKIDVEPLFLHRLWF